MEPVCPDAKSSGATTKATAAPGVVAVGASRGSAQAALLELAESRILAGFEPKKPVFLVRRGHVAPVIKALRDAQHNTVVRFKSPKGRDTFLYACLRHLSQIRDREWLIVGLGRRKGGGLERPSAVEGMWIGHGDASSVALTALAQRLVEQQVQVVRNGEVLIIHNHPPHPVKWVISQFFGWTPLASRQDRRTALAAHAATLRRIADGHATGHFRFYLVDEGELKEFFLPPLETLLGSPERTVAG